MTRTAVHFTDSETFGGAEQAMLSTLTGLDRARWRPVLLHHQEPGLDPLLKRAREAGVAVEPVPRLRGGQAVTHLPRFLRRLRACRPTVFHAHLGWPFGCRYGLAAASLARVPAVVATAHSFVAAPGGPASWGPRMLGSAGIDRYIAVSRGVADRLREELRVDHSTVTVVRPGIDPAPYGHRMEAAPPARRTPEDHRPVVLSAGRLSIEKGQRHLIDALAAVPDVVLLLAGEGPDRAVLEHQARELTVSDRVRFLGHREDMPTLLASCDLVVLPSLSEGLPLVALEAMAAGRPVIASAISGVDEVVVDRETGVLVPPADASALARAIRMLLSDPALADGLAAAGRSRVEREFSVSKMVEETMRVYGEVLSGEVSRSTAAD